MMQQKYDTEKLNFVSAFLQTCFLNDLTTLTATDLDPGEEDHDCDGAVEDDLPVTQELKVRVLLGPTQQVFQLVDDGERSVDVEDDAAHRQHDDDDVEDVPETLEVRHVMLLDLSTRHGSMCHVSTRHTQISFKGGKNIGSIITCHVTL